MAEITYNGITLADQEDRKITREEMKKISGLSASRLSQLVVVIPPVGKRAKDATYNKRLKRRNGAGYEKLFSLRMLLTYLINNPVNETKQKAGRFKGKGTKRYVRNRSGIATARK